jgi:hypothetical protein
VFEDIKTGLEQAISIEKGKKLIMREYLFHGKRKNNDEWVEGYLNYNRTINQYYIMDDVNSFPIPVYESSVGQYTGMNEFVLTDETRNAPLFEGDVVEVWGWRTVRGNNQSQYDKKVKVRGVIYFSHGQWHIDYDNNYNKSLAKLEGSETQEREVSGASQLYYYGYHYDDIVKYRAKELEWHGRFHNEDEISGHYDIKKIGNVFDNADLLEV